MVACAKVEAPSKGRKQITMKSVLILWLSAFYGNYTASQAVDTLEPLFQQNRDFYLSGPHTLQRQV
jgi:hypothetical protein